MGFINSIGLWFEKLIDGFKIGRLGHLLTLKGNVEIEGGLTAYEHTFQDKNGIVAHLDDLPATPTGLEALDESNGIGWRLIGRDPANFGNIGLNAVDLSTSSGASSTKGATGQYSYAESSNNQASGNQSHAEGNNTIASGTASHSEGWFTEAIGGYSHAEGRFTIASAPDSHAGGIENFARAQSETSIGTWGTDYTPAGGGNEHATDRLFNLGNGGSLFGWVRRDAFTIFKNGAIQIFRATLASITNAAAGFLIFDSGNSNRPTIHNGTDWKGLAYVDEVGVSTGLESITEGSNTGWRLVGRNPDNYGNIGSGAIDFSASTTASTTRGALAFQSTAIGTNVTISSGAHYGGVWGFNSSILSGSYSHIIGESNTIGGASGGSRSYIIGDSNTSTVERSYAIGYSNTIGGGNFGSMPRIAIGAGNTITSSHPAYLFGQENTTAHNIVVLSGRGLTASTSGEVIVGSYNTTYTSLGNNNDRYFSIGNGLDNNNRANAMTILRNGRMGIGFNQFQTTTDAELLQVNGNILSEGLRVANTVFEVTTTLEGDNVKVQDDNSLHRSVLQANSLLFSDNAFNIALVPDIGFGIASNKQLFIPNANGTLATEEWVEPQLHVFKTKVTITPAQMLDLLANPVELIPAPGPGRVINTLGFSSYLDFNTTGYDFGGSELFLRCGTEYLFGILVNQTESTYRTRAIATSTTDTLANTPITLQVETTNATQGDSPITIIVTYTIDDFN